ncbi:MAG TPA: hypothetical protein VM370_04930 [Candidatus Thermoplasmatota archaeon]|nr:hypothetical protein [Candidatus Thermoplasmatota archaeon]
MPTKLDQVRKLLAEGYELDDVENAGGMMEARFRRGSKTITVRFLPSEAEALLLKGPLRL